MIHRVLHVHPSWVSSLDARLLLARMIPGANGFTQLERMGIPAARVLHALKMGGSCRRLNLLATMDTRGLRPNLWTGCNSSGPLFSESGELVGMVYDIETGSHGPAISIETMLELLRAAAVPGETGHCGTNWRRPLGAFPLLSTPSTSGNGAYLPG